jgi:hypothetical protein
VVSGVSPMLYSYTLANSVLLSSLKRQEDLVRRSDGSNPGIVRFSLLSTAGVSGTAQAGDITFEVAGQAGAVSTLDGQIRVTETATHLAFLPLIVCCPLASENRSALVRFPAPRLLLVGCRPFYRLEEALGVSPRSPPANKA